MNTLAAPAAQAPPAGVAPRALQSATTEARWVRAVLIALALGFLTLFLFVPSLASAVGILVPVGALIAIGVARILYKKNLL